MRADLWVIECRDEGGVLDFTGAQPEDAFGLAAIAGITEDGMAKVIFARMPDALLTGDSLAAWPRLIDPRWRARRKTW